MFSKLKITFDCLLTLHLKICEFLIIVHMYCWRHLHIVNCPYFLDIFIKNMMF